MRGRARSDALTARRLTRLGHTVAEAENGKIGLDMLREAWTAGEERYDLLLLDNSMPVMSGVDVIRASLSTDSTLIGPGEVRRIGLKTYCCGASGNALLSDQQEFLDAGLDRMLTCVGARTASCSLCPSKPLLERNVRDVLDEALQRRAERLRLTRPTAPRMASIASTLESAARSRSGSKDSPSPSPPPPPSS